MLHNCTTFGLIKSRNYILHYFRPSGPFFFFWVFTFCNVVNMINSITAFLFLNKDISLRSTVRDAPSLCAKVLSNRPDLVRSTIGASRHSRLKAKPSPEHPKWERNLQFLPLSETKGIPTIPYTGDRGALPRGWGGGKGPFISHAPATQPIPFCNFRTLHDLSCQGWSLISLKCRQSSPPPN